MQLTLAAPRPIGTITVVPRPVIGDLPLWVAISVNGGPERQVLLTPGRNRVRIDASAVRTLRFRLTHVTGTELLFGAGGLEEIEIPGLTPVTESLRLPTLLAARTARLNTSHDEISIVLARQTADFPTRAGNVQDAPDARNEIDATDPETGIRRIVTLPSSRHFTASGWATVAPSAPDDAIDALTGTLRGWSITSSSRFEGVPGSRASSAFDGDRSTAWVGNLTLSTTGIGVAQVVAPPVPWLSIRGPRADPAQAPGPDRRTGPVRLARRRPGRHRRGREPAAAGRARRHRRASAPGHDPQALDQDPRRSPRRRRSRRTVAERSRDRRGPLSVRSTAPAPDRVIPEPVRSAHDHRTGQEPYHWPPRAPSRRSTTDRL